MKKLLILTLLVSNWAFKSNAQQDLQLTQFMFDKLSFNPGFTGMNEHLCATGFFRNQWTGYSDAPRTALINAHMPLPVAYGGVGLSFYSDNLGAETNTSYRLSYSYHYAVGGSIGGTLGIGASLGFFSQKYNNNWRPTDGLGSVDPVINNANQTQSTFDPSIGLYYQNTNYYVGISATHILGSDLSDVGTKLRQHIYVTAGYEYELDGVDIKLTPNVLVKYSSSTTVDVNVNALYMEKFLFGLTYRNQDAVAPILGVNLPLQNIGNLRVAYSYDVTTSTIGKHSSGTHEVSLNFCLNPVKVIVREVHPRL